MLDRFEKVLKIICLAMAALLVWDLSDSFLQGDPLAHLTIPELPVLPGATNATTNATVKAASKETKAVTKSGVTNTVAGTNVSAVTNAPKGTNLASGTNSLKGTNATPKMAQGGPSAGRPPLPEMMMNGGTPGGPMGAMKKPELPHDVQARVDRIVNNEVFGPVPHPMPMELLGISDNEAYFRATNGWTGAIKVGSEMSGIKLLRVGINRVLVETDGEKKELTIFGGAGSESLMPKPSDLPPPKTSATNSPATNAPVHGAGTNAASTNQAASSKLKETP